MARKYPDFPIVLETVRECLQDVYDVPAVVELMTGIAQRRVRVLEVETAQPSPFAASLLFGYVGAFMYEGDSPLAERRAAALSLDSTLLAELLGRVELRELLDPAVIAATGRQLQHLSDDRLARDAEAVADLLRLLGPLTEDEVAARANVADGINIGGWLEGLRAARRALTVSFAGRSWWVAIEDIGRLRDGVGAAVPLGVPATFTEAVADPLGELLGRYARTHTPFTTAEAAARFGLGLRVTADVLGRLADDGRLVRGDFVAAGRAVRRQLAASSGATPTCCGSCGDARWPRCGPRSSRSAPPPTRGSCRPGSRWAPATRVSTGWCPPSTSWPASAFRPRRSNRWCSPRGSATTPRRCSTSCSRPGEVTWSGAGSISGSDGWIALHAADSAPLTLAAARRDRLHRYPPGDAGHPGGRRRVLLPPARSRADPASPSSKPRCGN